MSKVLHLPKHLQKVDTEDRGSLRQLAPMLQPWIPLQRTTNPPCTLSSLDYPSFTHLQVRVVSLVLYWRRREPEHI